MIKNVEKLKEEIMKKVEEKVEEYIENMQEESNKEIFSINKIESLLGKAVKETKEIIVDKTTELLKNVDEEKIIDKKKKNIEHL